MFGSNYVAGASDVFHSTFEDLTAQQKQVNRLEIHDFTSDVIRTALRFVYGGELYKRPSKDHEHMVQVARFGQKYEVDKLVDACLQVLYLDTNLFNVADILTMVENANFVHGKELRDNLIGYVAM